MKQGKKKKKIAGPGQDARNRLTVSFPEIRKKQLKSIQNGTGLDYTCLVRYAVEILVESFLNGDFDLQRAVKCQTVKGRKAGR
jgi:hypothetical protein